MHSAKCSLTIIRPIRASAPRTAANCIKTIWTRTISLNHGFDGPQMSFRARQSVHFNEIGPILKARFLEEGFLIHPLGNTL